MYIFVTHSSGYDYLKELYIPLRKSPLNEQHELFLPMENGREVMSKDIIASHDVVVAEVSYPSTGQGIELGWADVLNKPIICIHKKGKKYSGAIPAVTTVFLEYEDARDMIARLSEALEKPG